MLDKVYQKRRFVASVNATNGMVWFNADVVVSLVAGSYGVTICPAINSFSERKISRGKRSTRSKPLL